MTNQIFNQPQSTSPLSTAIITVPVIYAGFLRRFFAVVIDTCFIGVLNMILQRLLGADFYTSLLSGTFTSLIYTSLFDSSELMGTPGKALLGLAIVNEVNQDRISFKTALLRVLCKYLSYILFIGYIIQLFNQKRQTLHDLMTNTVVIRKDSNGINYFTAFKNNFNKVLNN